MTRQDQNPPRQNNNNNSYNNRGNYRGGGNNRGRGRGRGRGNGGLRCQVCGIPGHGALTCCNRFNHAYQNKYDRGGNSATTGIYNTDPYWYVDCGATDLLTSDLDRLTVQDRHQGKDQVQVANGTGLNISHIGHSKISGLGKTLALKNILRVPQISKHLRHFVTHHLIKHLQALE